MNFFKKNKILIYIYIYKKKRTKNTMMKVKKQMKLYEKQVKFKIYNYTGMTKKVIL